MYNATGSSAYNQGALQVTGGVGIGQNLHVRGTSNVTGATTLSSTLAVTGNTRLANVAVSGTLDASGVTTISNSTNTALTTSGALVVPNGSVGIGQRLNVGGVTSITNTTASGNTTSGALVVSGGVGIGGNLWSAGYVSAGAGNNIVRIAGGPGTGERCLYIHYNGTGTSSDYGIIQAEHQGTAYRNLSLNPLGGNVGIGTTTPSWSLEVISSSGSPLRIRNSLALGSAQTNTSQILQYSSNLYGNTSLVSMYNYRFAAGNDWTGVSTRLQQTIDVTGMGYIEFNCPIGGNFSGGGSIGIYGHYQGVSGPSGITISGNGLVGIGTTSPPWLTTIAANNPGYVCNSTAANNGLNDFQSKAPFVIYDAGYSTYGIGLKMGLFRDTGGAYIQCENANTGARPIALQPYAGNVGIGTNAPNCKFQTIGIANISGTNTYAVNNNHMATGSLTLGDWKVNYGGGNNWNSNTAGLMLECADNTEIMVHDSGLRLASFMYYAGASNLFTIGRNAGWGVTNTSVAGTLSVSGATTLSSTLGVTGVSTFSEQIDVTTTKVVNFGSNVTKEANAGKIGYGTFDSNASLNIVGAGITGVNRCVRIWECLSVNASANTTSTIYAGLGTYANLTCAAGTRPSVQFRNDGDNFYMLLTNNGDPTGGWNDLRPFYMNTSNGAIYMNKVFYPGMVCGWYNNSGNTHDGYMYYITCSRILIDPYDIDDYWYVLPGFKFVLYDGGRYTGTVMATIDNYSGTSVLRGRPSTFNRTASVAVYFMYDSNFISISGLS